MFTHNKKVINLLIFLLFIIIAFIVAKIFSKPTTLGIKNKIDQLRSETQPKLIH